MSQRQENSASVIFQLPSGEQVVTTSPEDYGVGSGLPYSGTILGKSRSEAEPLVTTPRPTVAGKAGASVVLQFPDGSQRVTADPEGDGIKSG